MIGFKEEVAEYGINGNHGLVGLYDFLLGASGAIEHACGYIAVCGYRRATELDKLWCQCVADTLQILGGEVLVGITNADEWVGVERHLTVGFGELHIGPCSDGKCLSIFGDGYLATAGEEGCVAVGNVIVAVIDDAVVEIGLIEFV